MAASRAATLLAAVSVVTSDTSVGHGAPAGERAHRVAASPAAFLVALMTFRRHCRAHAAS